MTTYDAIEKLINERILGTYEEAWKAIMRAYNSRRIDWMELVELDKFAKQIV